MKEIKTRIVRLKHDITAKVGDYLAIKTTGDEQIQVQVITAAVAELLGATVTEQLELPKATPIPVPPPMTTYSMQNRYVSHPTVRSKHGTVARGDDQFNLRIDILTLIDADPGLCLRQIQNSLGAKWRDGQVQGALYKLEQEGEVISERHPTFRKLNVYYINPIKKLKNNCAKSS